MKEKKWYQKWWVILLLILGVFLSVFILVIFTQIPFWIGDYFPLINSHISAGEILLFIGAVLTFIGTLFLGIVALFQNKKLMKLEEGKYKPSLEIYFNEGILITKKSIPRIYENYTKYFHKYFNYDYSFAEDTPNGKFLGAFIQLKLVNVGSVAISELQLRKISLT